MHMLWDLLLHLKVGCIGQYDAVPSCLFQNEWFISSSVGSAAEDGLQLL